MNLIRRNSKQGPVGGQTFFPLSPTDVVRAKYVGKNLRDIGGPAAVVDVAVVRRNCDSMLNTTRALGLHFRAHVKTHKTVEISRLQVGDGPEPANVVVSTIAEAELLLPFLQECKTNGREVTVIYGIPPSSTCFERLSYIMDTLGPGSVGFLIDHPSQLHNLFSDPNAKTEKIPIWVKLDTGYHRAGKLLDLPYNALLAGYMPIQQPPITRTAGSLFDRVPKYCISPQTPQLQALLEVILHTQNVSGKPNIVLKGFYSHYGDYSVSSAQEALDLLEVEIERSVEAAEQAKQIGFDKARITLSVGASPTTCSAQNLVADTDVGTRVKDLLIKTQESYDVEFHAGCYPFLDLQQLATHSRPTKSSGVGAPSMSTKDIGLRMLAEVLSVYPDREKPEALIGAGSLALGREPCKSYPGWAVVAPSPWRKGDDRIYDIDKPESTSGWTVGRISQEHGILTWEGAKADVRQLSVGEKVLLWPNHACIAGAGFGWYVVVDSDAAEPTKIQNVFIRCNGW